MLYVALKKQYDEAGDLKGFSNRFEAIDQDELDEMEDEELNDYFVIPLREAFDCKTRFARSTKTIN